jgi:hypothetical protein
MVPYLSRKRIEDVVKNIIIQIRIVWREYQKWYHLEIEETLSFDSNRFYDLAAFCTFKESVSP